MSNQEEQLQALNDIRNMMKRSSKFISLNGLSGVFIGLLAIITTIAIDYYSVSFQEHSQLKNYYQVLIKENGKLNMEIVITYGIIAAIALVLSFIVSALFTIRKAKKLNENIWNDVAKRLFINMMIPLTTGGILCLLMLHHLQPQFIAPMMLVFYGLALVNASKYTYDDIRYLGIIEICLGLVATFFVEEGLFFWAFGFGVMHFVYGVMMYFKYERNKA